MSTTMAGALADVSRLNGIASLSASWARTRERSWPALRRILSRSLPKIRGVELLPYYDLWRAKLGRFGLKSDLPESVRPPQPDAVKGWKDHLRARGVKVVG